MRLRINSGKHVASSKKINQRIESLDQNVDSPDVVFTEDSAGTRTLGQFIVAFFIAPLLVITMVFWSKLLLPVLQLPGEKDRKIEEHVIEEYGADRVATDASKLELIRKEWKLWAISNWISVLLILLLAVTQGFLTQYTMIFTAFSILGVSQLLAFLAGNQNSRNTHITESIKSHSDRYDEAVLVTGGEHHEGVADLLESHDDVSVDNPKRE